jgi:hypothetical protein
MTNMWRYGHYSIPPVGLAEQYDPVVAEYEQWFSTPLDFIDQQGVVLRSRHASSDFSQVAGL